ncbi:hypothetical protein HYPSUDRAFT_58568 [Hypholoma sublateritium FD-334 SS-4]|uniref:Uncharacterized protein n=1 Tax=Hypholoma sublateritium (strain FD-334 SS-4) TaxID=945553 RepID=A0A0D2NGN2_HYPSF|nr:hypothetical protein HYPSUDRAFT_58568 [Hypholoma sublateritium FD-334 SS-4]
MGPAPPAGGRKAKGASTARSSSSARMRPATRRRSARAPAQAAESADSAGCTRVLVGVVFSVRARAHHASWASAGPQQCVGANAKSLSAGQLERKRASAAGAETCRASQGMPSARCVKRASGRRAPNSAPRSAVCPRTAMSKRTSVALLAFTSAASASGPPSSPGWALMLCAASGAMVSTASARRPSRTGTAGISAPSAEYGRIRARSATLCASARKSALSKAPHHARSSGAARGSRHSMLSFSSTGSCASELSKRSARAGSGAGAAWLRYGMEEVAEPPLGGERGEEAARAGEARERGGVVREEARDVQPELGGQGRRHGASHSSSDSPPPPRALRNI